MKGTSLYGTILAQFSHTLSNRLRNDSSSFDIRPNTAKRLIYESSAEANPITIFITMFSNTPLSRTQEPWGDRFSASHYQYYWNSHLRSMYKDHSNIYNQKTGVAWMTNDSIGTRCDAKMVLADASLNGKQPSHRLITFVSDYSSKNCHQSSDDKWTGDVYAFRAATWENEIG